MMRRYAVLLTALAVGLLGLASAWDRETSARGWDAEEDQAVLFGNEAVDETAPDSDPAAEAAALQATLVQWGRGRAARADEGNGMSKAEFDALMALTLTAFQAPPVSVMVASSTTYVCSTSNPADTSCSVNKNSGTGDTGESSCSTTQVSSNNTDCSVSVTAPVAPKADNTTCSASGGGSGSQAYCSATTNTNGSATTQTCSTQGGVSTGTSDGTAACSASAATPNNQNNSCSTNGSVNTGPNNKGATCSTYQGQHQACSAGFSTFTTDSTTCSTSSTGGNNADKCSAFQSPTGQDGNKCSAIATQNTQTGGNATCSVSVPAGGSNDSCSVFQDSQGNTTNTLCTSYFGGGTTPSANFVCSAVNAGTQTQATGNCSVINTSGGLVSGPPTSGPNKGQCGDPNFHGHWPP